MNNEPINRRAFYRDAADRELFFERVMRDAGRPPFGAPSGNAGAGRYPPRLLSRRPRDQQFSQLRADQ
jgi:hypothetical protein